jgi:nitroreductase
MDVYEAIYLRKSVRSYLDKDIPHDVLTRILDAARHAPSASNRQEWRFVVVRDKNTRKKLCEAAFGQAYVSLAPVVLVCCAYTDNHVMACKQLCYPIDVAIAVDHITLCAVAEGLGTCWIGAFSEHEVKKILKINEEVRVVALLPMGYPQDPSQVEKHRLPLKVLVKYEKWA